MSHQKRANIYGGPVERKIENSIMEFFVNPSKVVSNKKKMKSYETYTLKNFEDLQQLSF